MNVKWKIYRLKGAICDVAIYTLRLLIISTDPHQINCLQIK